MALILVFFHYLVTCFMHEIKRSSSRETKRGEGDLTVELLREWSEQQGQDRDSVDWIPLQQQSAQTMPPQESSTGLLKM